MIKFEFLEPGVKSIINQNGIEYFYDGFVPSMRYLNKTTSIDTVKIVKFAEENNYSQTINYIIDKIINLKSD